MTEQAPPELIATCWTTAGDAAPQRGDEQSPFALEERIAAAAQAGWDGFGIVYADLEAYRTQHGLERLSRVLSDHGLERIELEFLGDWWTSGSRRAASDTMRRNLFTAAEALGARTVKIAPEMGRDPVNRERFVSEFDALASEAAEHGTRVALETLPFAGNMSTLREGVALVTEAANPAGGLCVDIWHVARAGTPYAEVTSIPVDHLFVVELDDAAAEPVGTLWDDTINARLLPGEGSFDVPAFINAVRETGFTGGWGVEVISDTHRSRGLEEAVRTAREAALDCFSEADSRLRE